MPRAIYLMIFLGVAIVPMLFFGMLSRTPDRSYNGSRSSGYYGSPYRRHTSFFYWGSSGRRSYRRSNYGNSGRSYSSGGYRGGGFRSGK